MMLPTNPLEDADQASSVIQRELVRALRLSFEAAAHDPLPEQIAMLLLRLALAESLMPTGHVDASRAFEDPAEGRTRLRR
ncbi:MAG TPA: hypothetical protein VIF88_11955 [Methylocystis sp.]|jgi:hypothetical protein